MAVTESISDNIIVLDTETIGLPIFTKYRGFFIPSNYSKYNTARVIEIGYFVYNKTGDVVSKKDMLIIPNGFIIENTEIHGIKHEDAERDGISFEKALEQLLNDLQSCDTFVAHNLMFDFNVILAECYRLLANGTNIIAKGVVDKMNNMKKICTIKLAKDKLKIDKKMKLVHLYKHLKGIDWEQKHRADDDARVCGECYWHLINM